MYINETTIPRYRRIPRIRERADLEQFVRTHLISNATGTFRYHPNSRQKLRFGRAKDNTDWHFMRSLYTLFNPRGYCRSIPREWSIRMVRGAGPMQLAMLWLEKAVQLMLRFRQLGAPAKEASAPDGRRIAARLTRDWERTSRKQRSASGPATPLHSRNRVELLLRVATRDIQPPWRQACFAWPPQSERPRSCRTSRPR